MGDPPSKVDGGQPGQTDVFEGIAERLEELGPLIREQAAGAAGGDVQLPAEDAPSPLEYDDHDTYLQETHAWAVDEFLGAVSDLEHRALELQQAVEVYPGPGDDRSEAATHREVVRDDLADVAGAVERLVLAGARLARIEAAHGKP